MPERRSVQEPEHSPSDRWLDFRRGALYSMDYGTQSMEPPARDHTPSPRITLGDLAKRLGLAKSTVCMALRGHPEIAAATQRRVQECARQCGYRPEPMLSALAAYRQHKRQPTDHGVLAWLINELTHDTLFSSPVYRQYYRGACDRAARLGYRLEEFELHKPEMSPGRLSDILLARSIQGILVAPQSGINTRLDMHWEWFSAVTFGSTLSHPRLHIVTSTQYRLGILSTRKLQELGYQRIGFFGSENTDLRTERNFTAGFQTASMDMPPSQRVPPYLIPDKDRAGQMLYHLDRSEDALAEIRQWVSQWQIDAIVCIGGLEGLLLRAGLRIPQDIAVALAGYQEGLPEYAGIDQRGFHTGAAAVDMVVGMIHRGERGVPEVPTRLLIEGVWVDGPSAPPASSRRKRPAKTKPSKRTPAR